MIHVRHTFDSCKISFIVDSGQLISVELCTKVNLQKSILEHSVFLNRK